MGALGDRPLPFDLSTRIGLALILWGGLLVLSERVAFHLERYSSQQQGNGSYQNDIHDRLYCVREYEF